MAVASGRQGGRFPPSVIEKRVFHTNVRLKMAKILTLDTARAKTKAIAMALITGVLYASA
jgi:hypothetical protein